MADSNSDRAVLVVDAHRDDRALEARIRHSRHRQEQLAGQESRLLNHAVDNAALRRDGQ
jgi:hypothetical protein